MLKWIRHAIRIPRCARSIMTSDNFQPLIAVVGATGTGKSKFAVELATRFNGEIINADALQLYEGLPITTNKIPIEERNGIPHHLLGIIPLTERPWTAPRFVSVALRVVSEIRSRGKLPIVVGGTHYYLQSLLFKDALASTTTDVNHATEGAGGEALTNDDLALRFPILDAETETLLAELQRVDPVMAQRWHPRDRRKIRRSLEIYLSTGRRASDVYAQQRKERTVEDGASGSNYGRDPLSRLRSPTLVFWIHCAVEALRPRLDRRVDGMIDAGLLEEAKLLASKHDELLASGHEADVSSGLYIAIGYKEFLPLLNALKNTRGKYASELGGLGSEVSSAVSENLSRNSLDKDTKHLDKETKHLHKDTKHLDKETKALLAHGMERTKIATRQYAKHQVHWIRTKLLRSMRAEREGKLYLIDATNLSDWDASVLKPGVDLVGRFLEIGAAGGGADGNAGSNASSDPDANKGKLISMPDPNTLSSAAAAELDPPNPSLSGPGSGPDSNFKQGSQFRSSNGDGDGGEAQTFVKKTCEVCGTVAVTQMGWEQHIKSRRHKKIVSLRRKERVGGNKKHETADRRTDGGPDEA